MGLGEVSINQAKALALLQGLEHMVKQGITEAKIFGDSLNMIRMIVTHTEPNDINLKQLYSRIQSKKSKFKQLRYYHVLRILNKG